MNFLRTITPLYWRVIVFLAAFVMISGGIGPRIISGKLLETGGFIVYGPIGKALIFTLAAFVLVARPKPPLALEPWQRRALGWVAAAGAMFFIAWLCVSSLLAGNHDFGQIILTHTSLMLCIVFVGLACFGTKNFRCIWTYYRPEIIKSLLIGVFFYVFLLLVYALWSALAFAVTACVSWMLEVGGIVTAVIPPNMLVLDKFGITIAQTCSGIESIALFTGLYVIVGLLEWHNLNKKRFFLVFPLALAVLFGFNIVRVYALIWAGYHLNPEIAFSLFHTYAGMIFFIIYSTVFWAIAYKYLVVQPPKKV